MRFHRERDGSLAGCVNRDRRERYGRGIRATYSSGAISLSSRQAGASGMKAGWEASE